MTTKITDYAGGDTIEILGVDGTPSRPTVFGQSFDHALAETDSFDFAGETTATAGDGDVDGRDFLIWQRHVGSVDTSAGQQGWQGWEINHGAGAGDAGGAQDVWFDDDGAAWY